MALSLGLEKQMYSKSIETKKTRGTRTQQDIINKSTGVASSDMIGGYWVLHRFFWPFLWPFCSTVTKCIEIKLSVSPFFHRLCRELFYMPLHCVPKTFNVVNGTILLMDDIVILSWNGMQSNQGTFDKGWGVLSEGGVCSKSDIRKCSDVTKILSFEECVKKMPEHTWLKVYGMTWKRDVQRGTFYLSFSVFLSGMKRPSDISVRVPKPTLQYKQTTKRPWCHTDDKQLLYTLQCAWGQRSDSDQTCSILIFNSPHYLQIPTWFPPMCVNELSVLSCRRFGNRCYNEGVEQGTG